MIYMCAWCRREIRDDRNSPSCEDSGPISHGVCEKCKSNFKFQMGAGFQEYIDDLEAPVVVVDSGGTVKTANCKAQTLVGKKQNEIAGLRGGDVFECAYARLPEGCGNTRHCSGCSIRRAVMRTFSDGCSAREISVCLHRSTAEHRVRTNLIISTELVGDVVLLRIDCIAAEANTAESAEAPFEEIRE